MDQATHQKKHQTTRTARRRSKTEFAGAGALVQLVGVVLLFAFPIGTLVGVLLLVIGHSMSTRLVCSVCGTRIEDKKVQVCPACGATFANRNRARSSQARRTGVGG